MVARISALVEIVRGSFGLRNKQGLHTFGFHEVRWHGGCPWRSANRGGRPWDAVLRSFPCRGSRRPGALRGSWAGAAKANRVRGEVPAVGRKCARRARLARVHRGDEYVVSSF